MSQRLQAALTFEAAVATLLTDVVALHGAEFGNVQFDAGGKLIIVAEHGLRAPFLLAFREVRTTNGCACGRAWQTGKPIVVANVELDEKYAPFREVAKEAAYRVDIHAVGTNRMTDATNSFRKAKGQVLHG